jgi:hypothetical protein
MDALMIPTHPEKGNFDAGIFRLMEGRSQEENDGSSELLGGCDRIQVADTPLAKASPNARGAEVGSENCALRGQG